MCVSNAELLKSGNAEQRGEAKFRSENGMIWDVIVAAYKRNERGDADELGGVYNGASNAVQGQLGQARQGGCDGDDQTFAPIYQSIKIDAM